MSKDATLKICPECGAGFIEINTLGPDTEDAPKTYFVRCVGCGYSLGPYSVLKTAFDEWQALDRSHPRIEGEDQDKPEQTETNTDKQQQTRLGGAIHMLPISQLVNHPKNVRKVYSDIDDLADSIRTRGVMQNLTVVPAPGHEKDLDLYYVVIGNRRLQAAKKAGLFELPCAIAWDMPEREQITIMVTENMQRTDLSLVEQAESFQLMLDLGETVQTIHEKTGLSETTVRHRLKLSELGIDHIEKRQRREAKAEEEGGKYYQLSIKDYEYLEKIKSVKQRRDILDKAESSENLRWRVNSQIEEEKRREELKAFGKVMAALGIQRDDKKGSWISGYERIKSYRLDGGLPESVGLPQKYKGKEKKMHWCEAYGTVYIMAPEQRTKKKETEEEKKLKERNKRREQIKASLKAMHAETAEFIRGVCEDKVGKPGNADVMKDIFWNMMIRSVQNGRMCMVDIRAFAAFLKKSTSYWSMTDEDCKDAALMPTWKQMLIAMAIRYDDNMFMDCVSYYGEYKKDIAADVKDYCKLLVKLGFSFSDKAYYDVLFGKSELYTKEEKEV